MSEGVPRASGVESAQSSAEKIATIKTELASLEDKLRTEYLQVHQEEVPQQAPKDSKAAHLNAAFEAFRTIIGLMEDGDIDTAKGYKNSQKFSKISPELAEKMGEILK